MKSSKPERRPSHPSPGTLTDFLKRDASVLGHFGPGTLWPWDTLVLGHFGTGTLRSSNTLVLGHCSPGTLRSWDTLDLGHFGPGTHWSWDTSVLGHIGPGTLRSWDTVDLGHFGPGAHWSWDTLIRGHISPMTHRHDPNFSSSFFVKRPQLSSCYFAAMVHAGHVCVSITDRTLTRTTESLTCLRSFACVYTRGLDL